MNKSPDKSGLDPQEQDHRRNPWVFLKISKFWKSNEALSKVAKKWGNYVLMWNILKEQASIMEA